MNKLTLEGSAKEIKGKIMQKYGVTFDNDEVFAEGKEQELLGKLQKATGKAKESLMEELRKL